MWYVAATYPTAEQSKAAWTKVYSIVTQYRLSVTINNMLLGSEHLVVALDSTAPEPELEQAIRSILSTGKPRILPIGIQHSLMQRRINRRLQAIDDGTGLARLENHSPSVVPYYGIGEPDVEQSLAALRGIVETLYERGYPFYRVHLEILRLKLQVDTEQGEPTEIVEILLNLYKLALERSDKYIFSDSALAMLSAVIDHSSEWIIVPDTLIEIEHPVHLLPHCKELIKAVTITEVNLIESNSAISDYAKGDAMAIVGAYPLFSHDYNIKAICTDGRIALSLCYDLELNKYGVSYEHTCPFEECAHFDPDEADLETFIHSADKIAYVCERCREHQRVLTAWIHTAIKIIHKEYAVTPEPAEYPEEVHTHTEKKLVPRHHGTGAPKLKTVEQSTHYTRVTFEVSEAQRARLRELEASEEVEPGAAKRANWLTLHGIGERIYVKKQIKDYPRKYPLRKDGTRSSGQIVVQKYPKMVPMLKPELRKQTVKYIVAKHYESRGDASNGK